MSELALARRVEGANAEALIKHSEICAQLFPDVGAATLRIGGGAASFVGADVPISYAVGLGLNGTVSEAEIGELVQFYVSRGTVPRVDVCPLADESLFAGLRQHQFQLHWFVNVLTRDLSLQDEIASLPDGIAVREAQPDEAELWTQVVDRGFADGGPLTEPRRRLCLLIFHRPEVRCYFAEWDGQFAGAGALFTENGYAGLSASSVLPEFRRRGVHAALIRKRLQTARALGCDLAGFFASPNSTSQRNAERHGFRVAYTKAVMKKTG